MVFPPSIFFFHSLITIHCTDIAQSSPELANKYIRSLCEVLASVPPGGMAGESAETISSITSLLYHTAARCERNRDAAHATLYGSTVCALLALAVAAASLRLVLDAVNYFLTLEKPESYWCVIRIQGFKKV